MTEEPSGFGIFDSFQAGFEWLFDFVVGGLISLLDMVVSWVVEKILLSTPYPSSDGFFATPESSGSFDPLYELHINGVLPLATLLLLLALGVIVFTNIWRTLTNDRRQVGGWCWLSLLPSSGGMLAVGT